MIKLMRNLLLIVFVFTLLACGNASQNNNGLEDSSMVLPDTVTTVDFDTVKSTPVDTVKLEVSHENKLVPSYTPTPKSDEYEEGYHKGYADGEEDAYTHSGYQSTYNSYNDYEGSAADDYKDGYSNGYEAGYDDNVEYEE